MKTLVKYIIIMLAATAATGCTHKDLGEEADENMRVRVVFDWKKSPDATPASMSLYLYERNGGKPLRYVFDNRDGGIISVPVGHYDAVAMSSDNTDWAMVRNTDKKENFEIYTDEVDGMNVDDLNEGLETYTSEEPDGAVVKTPDMLWTATDGTFDVNFGVEETVITLYPDEAICHYTIDIYDVENIDYLKDMTLFSTFSGMAGGIYPGQESATDNSMTLPLTMKVTEDGTSIHGEFMTFGECPDIYRSNNLHLYVFPEGESASVSPEGMTRAGDEEPDLSKAHAYTFDVSDQAHNATDPKHVHIVIHGLTLPHPIVNGGGLKPVVDDWLVEYIDIPMK